jgi:hypothetical protein
MGLDPTPQIDAAPAYDTVFLGIGASLQLARELLHLVLRKPGLAATARSVRQPAQTIRIVAMHPIAQCLTIHAT